MPKTKIVVTDFGGPDIDVEEAELRSSGLDIELVRLNARAPEEMFGVVDDADALLVQWAPVNRQVIARLTRCKIISRFGIGVDMVDLKAAGERGIPVANVPDYCIEEVSTSTMAFLLCLNRHVIPQDQAIHVGKWAWPQGIPYPVRLATQTLGVVGLGNIGRAVARKANCLGLRVLAHDPFIKPEQAAALQVTLASLEELLRASDYVSLHCPLTAETRHLIGAAQLAMMKPTAYLINMSRGPVVDQVALYQALVNKEIAGAALDVLEKEPPLADEPILKLDNVILAPHSASASNEALVQLRVDTARNVVLALRGQMPRSIVNRKELGWPPTKAN
ncbi:MAG: C-terminal binding protein [Anaerolineae bacterium]|nr:C-terminal binding protein [Anaerolineae bacterium]